MSAIFKRSEDGQSLENFDRVDEKEIKKNAGVDADKPVKDITDEEKRAIYEQLKQEKGITPDLDVIDGNASRDKVKADFDDVKVDKSFDSVSKDVKSGKDVVIVVGGGFLSKFSLNGGNGPAAFLNFMKDADKLKGDKDAEVYAVAYDMAAKPTAGINEYNKKDTNASTFYDKEVVAMTKGIFDPLLLNEDGSKRDIEGVKEDFQKVSFVGRAEASSVIDQVSSVLKERMAQLGYNEKEVAESVPQIAAINTAAVPSKAEIANQGFTKFNSYATNNTFAQANKMPFGDVELPAKSEDTIALKERELGLYTTMEADINSEKVKAVLGDVTNKPIQKNAVETGSHPVFHTNDELGSFSPVLKNVGSQVIGRKERLNPEAVLEKAGQDLGQEAEAKINQAKESPMVTVPGESVRAPETTPYAKQVKNARELNDKIAEKGGYESFIEDAKSKSELKSSAIEKKSLFDFASQTSERKIG